LLGFKLLLCRALPPVFLRIALLRICHG
jgi:hypothetical protein